MRIFFILLHFVYATAICTILLIHVGYPIYIESRQEKLAQRLKKTYNHKISELEVNISAIPKYKKKTLYQLKEIVVFSKYITDKQKIEKCIHLPFENVKEIETMYNIVKRKISIPQKVFLRYSTECNTSIFLSLSVPLLLLALSNIKLLYQ